MVTGSTPMLAASDVREAIRFYKEVLGFASSWEWGDPPVVGNVSNGKVSVMFNLQPQIAAQVEGHQHWFDVDEVDALYADHLERGAEIVSPIEDKPWERREYTVRDLTGYHLRFAGSPSYTPKGIQGSIDGVTLERRKPTLDEYRRVVGGGFYKDVVSESYLEGTWAGVVAIGPSGEVIGTTRIMHDAPGWFSVWDVAVLPEWQNRRIGSKMMEEAMAIVREVSPGAFVYLFTLKDGFYERLGFEKGTVHMIRV